MKGNSSSSFSSPLRGCISFNSSLYVSPESTSSIIKSPTFVSQIETPQKGSVDRLRKAMTTPNALPSFSASSITLFDDSFDSDLDLSFDVDHVAELLARPSGSATQAAAASLFSDDLAKAKEVSTSVESSAFKLSSVVTSPSNRVQNLEAAANSEITSRITNGIGQAQSEELPSFSVVVSPVSKHEDHTFSIHLNDWSLSKSVSVTPLQDSSKKQGEATQTVSNLAFEQETEWVDFDPFDEFKNPTDKEQSFTPYGDDAADDVTCQLREINGRLAVVERILRNQVGDGHSTGFFVDEESDDDKTITPRKAREVDSKLFGRFFLFDRKTTLFEI